MANRKNTKAKNRNGFFMIIGFSFSEYWTIKYSNYFEKQKKELAKHKIKCKPLDIMKPTVIFNIIINQCV